MRRSSIFLLLGAGLLAVMAARMVLNQGAEKSAQADVPQSYVIVAARPLKFGDRLSARDLRPQPWPGTLPDNAFANAQDVVGDGERSALRDIKEGEVIIATAITGGAGRLASSTLLGPDMRAVSLPVLETSGAGGFLAPGDRVDVFLTRKFDDDVAYAGLVVQGARVLAVGQSSDTSMAQPEIVKSATIEVTPAEAQKIALAQSVGEMHLALRATGDESRVPLQTVTAVESFGMRAPAKTPSGDSSGAAGLPRAAGPAMPPPIKGGGRSARCARHRNLGLSGAQMTWSACETPVRGTGMNRARIKPERRMAAALGRASIALPLLAVTLAAAIALPTPNGTARAQAARAQAARAQAARAQAARTQAFAQPDAKSGAVMAVPVNKSQVLKLDRAFSKAMVGNPEIADVMPLSSNSVYVLGRATGSTNLALYDRGGGLIAVVDLVVGPDTLALKRQIDDSFPGEAVRIGHANDSILLEGQVSSPMTAERIVALAETYAPQKVVNMMSVGSPQQVLLEVRISEMSRGTVKQLGINRVSWTNGTAISPGTGQEGAFLGFLSNLFGSTLNIEFEALERQGLVRTLANPNLVALSGETANFLAGGEIPIPVGVDIQGRVQIEFKQFGVALAFTPTVLGDGLVNLRVAPEVSSLDRELSIVLEGTTIPGLKVRRAVTSLELRDGQSFAMAGLIQSDSADTVRAVPLVGKLPIIGALFRSAGFQKQETELVITVTPRIVRPVRPDQIALPTDRVESPSMTDLFLMGRAESIKPMAPRPARTSAAPAPGGIDGEQGHIVR